jgi:sortase A
MLSTFRPRANEVSARDVAERATAAAIRAADAAIRAADAAIKAADAAVRLIDEDSGTVIMLEPAPAPLRENPSDSTVGEVWPAIGLGSSASPASPRPRRRLGSRALALTLLVIGGLVLIDAGVTLVWQEPISALYAKLRQDHLSGALQKVERAPPTPAQQRTLATLPDQRKRIAFLARSLQTHAGNGSPVARISIPRIDANFVVVKGTDTSDLESGPGIYPETVFPGIPGTTAIAGHRTTYLAPFRHIDALRRGSRILLSLPYAHFTYTVTGMQVVQPNDVRAAVSDVGYPRLVLSACTPLFTAEKRLLVFARLTSTVPVGAGRLPSTAPSAAASAVKAGREGGIGTGLGPVISTSIP